MRRVPQSLVGKLVEVRFRDHVHASSFPSEPMLILARGQLREIHDTYITLCPWEPEDGEEFEGNNETFSLITSAINDIRELEAVRTYQ